MKLFVAADFKSWSRLLGEARPDQNIADTANRLLDERLLSKAVRMHGAEDEDGDICYYPETKNVFDPKFQALLIDITPIEKVCEHVAGKIKALSGQLVSAENLYEPICGKCGVLLKPTGWSEVKE